MQAGSFAKQIKIGPPIVNDQRSLQAAIGKALDLPKADTFGPSAIWDAVALAVETLKNAPGRRAIILLTDGRATGNRLDVEAVAARAAAAGVLVNVVGEDSEIVLRQDANTGVRVRPGVALEFIANATGDWMFLTPRRPPCPVRCSKRCSRIYTNATRWRSRRPAVSHRRSASRSNVRASRFASAVRARRQRADGNGREPAYSGLPCRSGSQVSSRAPFSSHTANFCPRGPGYSVTPAYSPFALRM